MIRHDDIFIDMHIRITLYQQEELLLDNLPRFRQCHLSSGGSKPPPYFGKTNRFICCANRHIVKSRQTVVIPLQPRMLSIRFHRISPAKLLPSVSSSTSSSSATVAAMSQKPTRVPRFTGLTFGPAMIRGTYSRVWSVVAV